MSPFVSFLSLFETTQSDRASHTQPDADDAHNSNNTKQQTVETEKAAETEKHIFIIIKN